MPEIEFSSEEGIVLDSELEKLLSEKLIYLMSETGNQDKMLSLFFCSEETIKELNNSYRGVNKSTDILSWLYDEEDPIAEQETWGELVVCLDVCRRQAEKSGLSLKTELLRLTVHGLVHLMGYDHENSPEEEKRMLAREKELLSLIGLEGIYD